MSSSISVCSDILSVFLYHSLFSICLLLTVLQSSSLHHCTSMPPLFISMYAYFFFFYLFLQHCCPCPTPSFTSPDCSILHTHTLMHGGSPASIKICTGWHNRKRGNTYSHIVRMVSDWWTFTSQPPITFSGLPLDVFLFDWNCSWSFDMYKRESVLHQYTHTHTVIEETHQPTYCIPRLLQQELLQWLFTFTP